MKLKISACQTRLFSRFRTLRCVRRGGWLVGQLVSQGGGWDFFLDRKPDVNRHEEERERVQLEARPKAKVSLTNDFHPENSRTDCPHPVPARC